jgi:hypothetical protein
MRRTAVADFRSRRGIICVNALEISLDNLCLWVDGIAFLFDNDPNKRFGLVNAHVGLNSNASHSWEIR